MVSPISAPDNIAFDSSGNLWIATDGQIRASSFRMNDGIYVVPTDGPERGYLRQFLSGVPGGECSSLAFTPNDSMLFVSIQHPGADNPPTPGTYESPQSVWPDGRTRPRPGIVAVVRATPGADTVGL